MSGSLRTAALPELEPGRRWEGGLPGASPIHDPALRPLTVTDSQAVTLTGSLSRLGLGVIASGHRPSKHMILSSIDQTLPPE